MTLKMEKTAKDNQVKRGRSCSNGLRDLLVVSSDAGNIVAGVRRVLDVETALARDAVASYSAQKLGAFARKHRSNNQFEEASELGLEIGAGCQLLLDR